MCMIVFDYQLFKYWNLFMKKLYNEIFFVFFTYFHFTFDSGLGVSVSHQQLFSTLTSNSSFIVVSTIIRDKIGIHLIQWGEH